MVLARRQTGELAEAARAIDFPVRERQQALWFFLGHSHGGGIGFLARPAKTMAEDSIFLLGDSGQLQRANHQRYASEAILQGLVTNYPEVLTGEQIDALNPPRWLLLRQEAAIPDAENASNRWALDHLLIDQFGTPTFVEVKRSTDTRIRREVVGQMLDYVANAQAYWPVGRMRQMLAEEAGSAEMADHRIADLLQIESGNDEAVLAVEEFWQTIEENLRGAKVRLLFVADEIPRELRRLIEFLNTQFTRIEVLGIELRQYVGDGVRALVPRVIGQSEKAREQKRRSTPTRRTVDVPSLAVQLESCGEGIRAAADALVEHGESSGMEVRSTATGFNLRVPWEGGMKGCVYVWTNTSDARQSIEISVPFLPEGLRDSVLASFEELGFERQGADRTRWWLDSSVPLDPAEFSAALSSLITATLPCDS